MGSSPPPAKSSKHRNTWMSFRDVGMSVRDVGMSFRDVGMSFRDVGMSFASLILVYYREQSYKCSPQRHLEILCAPRNLKFNIVIIFFYSSSVMAPSSPVW